MNEMQITDDQIVDLIFERKIDLGHTKLSTMNSFHEILAKLEERLCYGKITRSKNTALCGIDGSSDSGDRSKSAKRPVGRTRKKAYDFV